MIRNKNRTAQNKISDPWHVWCDTKGGIDRQTSLESIDDRLSAMRGSSVVDCIRAAIDDISVAARNIVPEVPNYQKYSVDSLEDLRIYTDECDMDGGRRVVPLKNLLDENPFHENLSRHIEKISEAWPHEDAVEQLKRLSDQLIPFLYAVRSFGRKKIALAKNMGLVTAVEQLEKAYDSFCMIELTDDIEEDARRLFIERKITPYEFRVAICWAFELDREATEELNNKRASTRIACQKSISLNDKGGIMGNGVLDNDADYGKKIDNMTKQLKKLIPSQKNKSMDKLTVQKRDAVVKKWTEYTNECKKNRCRAMFKNFFEECSNDVIYYNNITEERCSLVDIAKSSDEVKAIVHNDREQKRQKNKNMSKQYRSKNKKSK